MSDSHPLAGKTVKIKDEVKGIGGELFVIEDYWHNVTGSSWMSATGNPAALQYAFRSGISGLPIDNEVLYGKVGGLGFLVHVSELAE